jgi:Domain of unknown function (DUF4440)
MNIRNVFVVTAAAFALMACTPASNAPANSNASNANTAKPAAAAPTKEALLAMDKQANEAYLKGDSKFFEGFLSDKFVMYPGGHRTTKADAVKMIADVKCEMKSLSLDDPQMSMIDADTYVLSYKNTLDATCNDGPGGKEMKAPSPVRAVTIWARNGDKWQAVFHGENMIVDPKNPPAAGDSKDARKEESKKDDKMADKKADDSKMAEKKTEDSKMGNKDDKTASNNSSATESAKATADANTEALAKLQTSGWEAWKAKDAKKFEEVTTSNLSFVDPLGNWFGTKSDTIKNWTTMDCEGVTKVGFKNAFATAVSPTVEILTGEGFADGTCFGQKNGDLHNVAVYVKEGSDWKLAFLFEAPPM